MSTALRTSSSRSGRKAGSPVAACSWAWRTRRSSCARLSFPMIDEKELRVGGRVSGAGGDPHPCRRGDPRLPGALHGPGRGRRAAPEDTACGRPKDMIGQFMAVATKAGLTIEGIDLQAFALARALASQGSFIDQGAPSDRAESTALVNIGTGVTNLVVCVNALPQFTRVINLGCDALVQALVNNRGITPAEAEVLRTTVGLSGEAPEGPIGDLEPDTVGEIHEVLGRHVRELLRRDPALYRLLPHAGTRRPDHEDSHSRRRQPDAQHRRHTSRRRCICLSSIGNPLRHDRREQVEARRQPSLRRSRRVWRSPWALRWTTRNKRHEAHQPASARATRQGRP